MELPFPKHDTHFESASMYHYKQCHPESSVILTVVTKAELEQEIYGAAKWAILLEFIVEFIQAVLK